VVHNLGMENCTVVRKCPSCVFSRCLSFVHNIKGCCLSSFTKYTDAAEKGAVIKQQRLIQTQYLGKYSV